MRKLTIKWRIMLWYTILLLLLLGIVLPLMYYTLSKTMYSDAKMLLQSEISRTTESLEYENKVIKLDEDLDLVESGTYVAIYSDDNQLLSGKLPQEFDLQITPQYGDIYKVNSNGHDWLVCDYSLIQNGEILGWIRIIKSLDAIDTTLGNLRMIFLIIIPIYFAVALLGGFFLAKRALSPINQITKTVKHIGQNDLTKRIQFSGPRDEVGELAETFDEMLDRLEDSFSHEKRFSSDVSHELRTPAAAIMISAEEALNGNKTNREYKDTIEAIFKESKKMSSMISQLLMMARSSEGKYIHEMESINISTLTKTIIDELSENTEHSDITISADIEDGIIMLAEQTLYIRLLCNLIDNALKYNIPGGWVKVTLKKNKDFIGLLVEDSGIGISEENLPKIWDRFFKAEPSRLDSSPGLGLSIVKWIAELHNGTIHVKSDSGKGSVFEIQFRLK